MTLPEDFAAAARAGGGLRASVLEAYAALASGGALTSWLVRSVPAFRDRLIADRLFFFKVWAEVAIDSGEALLVFPPCCCRCCTRAGVATAARHPQAPVGGCWVLQPCRAAALVQRLLPCCSTSARQSR